MWPNSQGIWRKRASGSHCLSLFSRLSGRLRSIAQRPPRLCCRRLSPAMSRCCNRRSSAGVEADVTDEVGFTPLMIAARAGNLQAVRYLLDQGANIDARTPVCGTALMQAALYGRDDVLHLLLARHADPNCRTDFGETALWYAIDHESPSPAIIRQLMNAGADPDLPCSLGDTPRRRCTQQRSHDPPGATPTHDGLSQPAAIARHSPLRCPAVQTSTESNTVLHWLLREFPRAKRTTFKDMLKDRRVLINDIPAIKLSQAVRPSDKLRVRPRGPLRAGTAADIASAAAHS